MNDWARDGHSAMMENLESLAERYRGDEELRARIDSGDAANALAEIGVAVPPGAEVRVVENTDDVYHVAMPADPSAELSDRALAPVAGGSTADAVPLSSAGTVSTIPSCIGCASTVSTKQGVLPRS